MTLEVFPRPFRLPSRAGDKLMGKPVSFLQNCVKNICFFLEISRWISRVFLSKELLIEIPRKSSPGNHQKALETFKLLLSFSQTGEKLIFRRLLKPTNLVFKHKIIKTMAIFPDPLSMRHVHMKNEENRRIIYGKSPSNDGEKF